MVIHSALIQIEPVQGDLDGNRKKVEIKIREAMTHIPKPDLILLPETWTSAYGGGDLQKQAAVNSESADGPSIRLLRKLAQEFHVWISAGSITLKEDTKYTNSSFLIDRSGAVIGQYDKIHLCSWVGEDTVFSHGDHPLILNTELGKLGTVICYDIRFVELTRINALAGVQILLAPACWSSSLDHYKTLIKARAIENQMFVISCNACGGNTFHDIGHSMVAAPDGTILAEAGDSEEILFADLDLGDIKNVRDVVNYIDDRQISVYRNYGLLDLPQ